LIMCLLPLFSLIIMDVQFHILGSKYLEDRRAIILFPSLIVSFAAWLNLSKYKINYFWAIVLMLFSFSHWAKTANLLSVKEWAYDSNNNKVIAYLEQKAIEKNDSLLVSSHWFFQGSLNFHARANPNSRIAMPLWAPEMPTDNRYDYYYIGNYTPDSTFYTLDTVFDNNHLYKRRKITIK
jgi:hypothetical protein